MKPKFRQKGLACLALKYLMRKLSQRQEDYSHPSQWWFAGELAVNMLDLSIIKPSVMGHDDVDW